MASPSLSLLRLMHLVTPALPIGAFAYSQGQEYAIDCGWLKTPEQVEDWIGGVLHKGVGRLDAPVLLRLYQAWQQDDQAAIEHWNRFLLASRESRELLEEDLQVGRALAILLASLGVERATPWRDRETSLASQFALAAVHWQIEAHQCLLGYLWSWCENQIAAAGKTLPLGQTDAHNMLQRLLQQIPPVAEQASELGDEEIGGSLPGFAIASARHETQYSRLFRS